MIPITYWVISTLSVNKVYRIVLQLQPKGDQWKWAPDDSAAVNYYIRDAGSTPTQADIATTDESWSQYLMYQTLAGNPSKWDVFISGNEANEWNGKSSITLYEVGDTNDASDPDASGQKGIYPYDGTNWWDSINDNVAQDNWQVIEF